MAISDKLNYLIETKQLFKDRLNSLGAEITSSTTFRNYLNWLDTFYGEVSDKTDISINGVIGRTSQESTTGKNLIKFTDAKSYAYANGVPINPTGNNYVTSMDNNSFSITYGSNSFIGVVSDIMELQPNTQYTISFNRTQNSNFQQRVHFLNVALDGTLSLNRAINGGVYGSPYTYTFTTGETGRTAIMISVNNATPRGESETITNIQVELGSTATDFEPFTNGPSPNPDYPQPINNLSGDVPYKVSGKNLFKASPSNYKQGLIITYDSDTGEITFGGTTTGAYSTLSNFTDANVPAGEYTFSIDKTLPYNITLRFRNASGQYPTFITIPSGSLYNTITTSYDAVRLEIVYHINSSGITVPTTTIKPMLEKGSIATTYEPYIEPQTFNIPLKSKNLFDKDNPNIMNAYFSTAQATITFNSANKMIYIPIKPNTTYTMQKINSAQFYLGYINELPAENIEVFGITNTTTSIDTNHKSITITTGANAKYLVSRIYQTSQDKTITLQQVLDTIQIEENSTATDYEPYYDIELCKIGTYEDKIYSSNGRFYLNKNIGKETDDGSSDEPWGSLNRQINGCYGFRHNGLYSEILLCDKLTNYTAAQLYQGIGEGIGYSSAGGYLAVYIKAERVSSYATTGLRTFLANNPITYYYQLATPTTTEITQENYPSLYNALKQIQDYLTSYKINKEFILGYSSPEIEY